MIRDLCDIFTNDRDLSKILKPFCLPLIAQSRSQRELCSYQRAFSTFFRVFQKRSNGFRYQVTCSDQPENLNGKSYSKLNLNTTLSQ